MSRPTVQLLAIALLERLGGGRYDEAMCGDLLEEFARTGSGWRLTRQVGAALGLALWKRAGGWARPVVFSVGWSVLYPVWRGGEPMSVARAVATHANLLDWPFSSLLQLANAGGPALLFVWLGFVLYAACDLMRGRVTSRSALLRGLSLSSSALLVSSLALMARLSVEGLNLQLLGTASFPNAEARSAMSLPVALSVLAATIAAGAARRRISGRRV